jgi:hypothetical protein
MTSRLRRFNDPALTRLNDLKRPNHFVIEAAQRRSHSVIE